MPLRRAIGVVLVAACAEADDGGAAASAVVSVDPRSIYFGLVEWGSTATERITISNDGDAAADVAGLQLSTDEVVVDDVGPFTIPAGDAVERTLEWTPPTIDGLDASLEVLGKDGPYTMISVTGGTSYAVLDVLENDGADFGAVPVGCKRVAHVTLANDGVADLLVSWTPETGQAEFVLRDSSGSSLEAPISIAPRSSERIDVEYSPREVHEIDSTLEIATNDPSAPVVEVDVRAEGVWNEPHVSDWIVGPDAQTILFHVNQRVVRESWNEPWFDRLEQFLPALFDGLLAAHVPFRLAFAIQSDGNVEGAVPYIDDSFTSMEAVDAAEGMLIDDGGDNDAGLETCLAMLEANALWALDDASPWPQSKLDLVVINPDAEQSPGDATYYVGEFEELKNSSNVAVHGIAGDIPSGCGGSAGSLIYADPSPTLYDAALATDGAYLSICDEDWTTLATTLVAASMQRTGFHFGERPIPESLEVFVDGTEVPSGWMYDPATNALLFDEASLPADGAVVRAEYYLGDSCE